MRETRISPGLRQGLHPGGGVHRDAADVVAAELDLAGVGAGPDLDAERAEGGDDLDGAANGAGGPVEGGDEAVTGRVDLPTAEAGQLASHHGVVGVEERAPALVAEVGGPLG